MITLSSNDDFCISHLQIYAIIPLIWEIFSIKQGLEKRKDVFSPLNNMERFRSPVHHISDVGLKYG
jgi:hypothetical protein